MTRLLRTEEKSAGGRWSIVEILFQKKSWQRRAGRRHRGIKRGSLCHRECRYWRSPPNRIAIHMLPHSLRRAGPDRCRDGSCVAESPRSQCYDKRTHDNADQRPAPPGHRAKRSVSGFSFSHNNLKINYTHGVPGSKVTVIHRRDVDSLNRNRSDTSAARIRSTALHGLLQLNSSLSPGRAGS